MLKLVIKNQVHFFLHTPTPEYNFQVKLSGLDVKDNTRYMGVNEWIQFFGGTQNLFLAFRAKNSGPTGLFSIRFFYAMRDTDQLLCNLVENEPWGKMIISLSLNITMKGVGGASVIAKFQSWRHNSGLYHNSIDSVYSKESICMISMLFNGTRLGMFSIDGAFLVW